MRVVSRGKGHLPKASQRYIHLAQSFNETPLFSWLFLVLNFYILLAVRLSMASGPCPKDQLPLLLQLKKSLKFDEASSTKLVKWQNGSDYCSWEGVSCNKGCVTYLDLSSESITGGLDNASALFSLQYIEHLNLAYNNFNYTRIPPQFNKLADLNHLNLSNAGFAGLIPMEISNLKRLVFLDLSTIYYPGQPALQLKDQNLKLFIGNLSEIVQLHLDGVKISAQGDQWGQAISSSLPKLRVLSLSSCNLSGPIHPSLQKLQSLSEIRIENNNLSAPVPEFLSNFTNLTSLRLMNSGLQGTFPQKIFLVPTLQMIDLINNADLQGSLPDFPKNGALRSLFLARTNFSGSLPESIGNLKMLSRVDLSFCNFTGPIPKAIENLTELVYVDMSGNKHNGSVPLLRMAKNLTDINLSYNELTGQINPTHWKNLTYLVKLEVGNNKLDGSIPLSLFYLPSLKQLVLSYNQFSGQLLEFANISYTSLDTLDLSSNNLEGPVPKSISNLQQLKILSLSSNNFSGSFSLNALQQLRNLSSLDLSYNSLWITYDHNNSSYASFPEFSTLKLASGKLSMVPEFLKYQSGLFYLDLSDNEIHGEIPNWIWRLDLNLLNLSCNFLVNFEGPLFNITSTLLLLDLHSNKFQGQIPPFPPLATYLDYSRNNFSSSIQTNIGDFLGYTVFFSLSSNNFHGIIPPSMCNATNLEVLDLSNNSLSGTIPECMTAMSETLVVLNLGRNKLTGTISDHFPRVCRMRTLELNGNHIDGLFPKSLANCMELELVNLGNNVVMDTFPLILSNIFTLRVLILRSNKFYGPIVCTVGTWPMLQIVDIAHNNFSGEIPGQCLANWQTMMANPDNGFSRDNHLQFRVFVLTDVFYEDVVTVTNKGREMELVKVLTIFTCIDFSSNKFSGSIPEEMGELKSLYALNLSSNALSGTIPSSLGNLHQLESLDLSRNSLRGPIPTQLANYLTFLSFLNLSYNHLVGRIPTGPQFATFGADSFKGNKGLYGQPLDGGEEALSPPPLQRSIPSSAHDLNWDFLSAEFGLIFGLGIAIGSLVLCKRWRLWYFRSTFHILFEIFPQLEHRIGNHRRHVSINPR